MRIVHYTLGLYPKRTGGLNRYATDLMFEQSREHEVSMLMPGSWRPWRRRCYICHKGNDRNLEIFHLRNALPLPLLYGIKRQKNFRGGKIDVQSFERFYEKVKPEILHLHTLMGMPEEVLRFFKEKGVKIVYTSHDYFGICPKVNLINQDGVLCPGPEPQRCAICNANAPSPFFLRIRNSRMAFVIRDFARWLKSMINF